MITIMRFCIEMFSSTKEIYDGVLETENQIHFQTERLMISSFRT